VRPGQQDPRCCKRTATAIAAVLITGNQRGEDPHSGALDGCPVFALTWEPVVAKRQNVVRHRQSNDIRLDPFAAKR